jgi:tRNA (guanine-N7-)-methyltransferase
MGKKNKLKKFSEIRSFPNVFENYNPTEPILTSDGLNEIFLKGSWKEKVFGNQNDLILELACGGGEYTLEMAKRYKNRNFLGVDIKGNRIWKGARVALSDEIKNAAFLRTRIEMIDFFIDSHEIDEIWITFPDPFLRKSKSNRRLTSENFLRKYEKICKPGAYLHLKTDSLPLFEFSLETLKNQSKWKLLIEVRNIHQTKPSIDNLDILTFYEKMHLEDSREIYYMRAKYLG